MKTRSVRCFDCDLSHKTPCDASSTICPHCSSYISLEDIVLTDQQTREIRTRGDVTIKKGVTLVGGISCHNLRVYGKVIGRLDCSGKLDFHASGRMLGEVKAAVLEIHRKCCLHFVHEVRANEVLVHGEAHGEFLCDGRLHIGRKGALYGAIVPRSVFVETGGTLSGNLQILSDRPRKSVSPGTPAPSISAQRLAPDSPTAVPA